jgi:quercetin dioxygenase-like cupin family protein
MQVRSRRLFAWVVVVNILSGGPAGVAKEEPAFVRITPEEVQWRDIPDSHGAQEAVLLGNPEKPGIYVVRVKFPPHVMDAPHWHPNARYVTVLEGTWYAGTSNTFDIAKAVPLKAGSFMLHPAKAVHWDGSAGNETVIVQIIGEGPTEGGQVDPKQPMWKVVSREKGI